MMIFGSLIPSAKAMTDPTTSSKANAQIREIFIDVFLFTKGISLGNLLPALGECGEGSSFNSAGQAETTIVKKYFRTTCKLLRTVLELCKSVHVLAPGRPELKKSRSPKAPAVQLVVCPDKIDSLALTVEMRLAASPGYALLRGRTVK